MVHQVKGVHTGTGVRSGETQYAIEVIDMTSAPHGGYGQPSATTHPDTRMVSGAAGASFRRVGIGPMMFYASDTTGEFSRYRWSSYGASEHYTVAEHPIAAARVV